MGLFSRIKEFFMGIFRKQDMKNVTGIHPQISDGMLDEVEKWRDIYGGTPPWVKNPKFDKTTNFAKTVCRDISQKITSEASITTGDEATDILLAKISTSLPEKVERILALGASVARPYYDETGKTIRVEWFPADRVVPLQWHDDELRSVALLDFCSPNIDGSKRTYVKVETHVWGDRSTTIRSRAFNWNNGYIGSEVELAGIPDWSHLSSKEIEVKNIDHPLFVYVKTPIANNIDGSNNGVSIFANAIDQLEELDGTFSSMSWERVAGESKVFVAESMIPQKMREDGTVYDDLSAVDKRMYKVLDGGVEKNLFEVSSPTLRFDQYKTQMDQLISIACKNMGLDAKSFLTDHQGDPVTAQQILSEKNETYTTVLNFQEKMLKPSIMAILRGVRALQLLYGIKDGLVPEEEDNISVSFGDSILVDEESEKKMAIDEVQRGLRSKLSYLVDYRGMSEEEALAELERIKADAPVVDYFGMGEEA